MHEGEMTYQVPITVEGTFNESMRH